ncbi:30S ribosomal protein S4 [Candidatus Parvarchaeota archaeon]|nr:30S ribosomal protein S4 [Candidatus Parvarchaeota archaeon]
MGDPRKLKSKHETPRKIWDETRIKEESKLIGEYGLKNTRELWVALASLKQLRREARRLLSLGGEGQKNSQQVLLKLQRLGIGKDVTSAEQILTLTVRDFLERRLQTRVLKLGLARSAKQARQLITHGFIAVNGRRTTAPSYMIPKSLEASIALYKKIDITPRGNEQKAAAQKQPEQAQQEPAQPQAA